LSGLSDYVLSSFPSISTGTWDILHEKAILVNATVEVFHIFIHRFSNLFDAASHVACKALTRLIILCQVLDCRNDGDVSIEDNIPSPKQLREKCLTVATELMRYLGDSLGSGGVETPTWETFRSVYAGCLGICEGEHGCAAFLLLFIISAVVLGAGTSEFPLEFSIFQQPHKREVTSIPDKVCGVCSHSVAYCDGLMAERGCSRTYKTCLPSLSGALSKLSSCFASFSMYWLSQRRRQFLHSHSTRTSYFV
jgi:hypothetical protein